MVHARDLSKYCCDINHRFVIGPRMDGIWQEEAKWE